MNHVIAHDLDIPMAKKVIDRAFGEYQRRYAHYQPTFRWVSERQAEIGFHAMAITVRGEIEVAEQKVTVELDVPFLLRPFRKRAMEIIDREVKLWIGKARAGEI